MIKDFFTNLFTILAFLFFTVLILSQCTPKETEHSPSKQQPVQNTQRVEDDEKDLLEDAKRHAEFWGMMIPAL